MSLKSFKQRWPWCLAFFGTLCACEATARGQFKTPNTYADYYSRELQQGTTPPVSIYPERYTYNKYFYRNPAVSPYSNLLRYQTPGSLPNYFRYVAPEQQRRQQMQLRMNVPLRAGRSTASAVGSSFSSGRAPGVYQNHWYGSRRAMGLP